MKRSGTSWIVCLVLAAVLAGPAWAAEPNCPMCGAEMGAAKFTVTLKDGKQKLYACPRCAMLDTDVRAAKALSATDFLSRKTVDDLEIKSWGEYHRKPAGKDARAERRPLPGAVA